MATTRTKVSLKKDLKMEMPSSIKPMLCTLQQQPVADEHFLHEVKWDGYRLISFVNGNSVRMDSRSGLDYTKKYPPVVKALQQLKHKVIIDGEVIVLNEEGHPDFDALQKYNGHETPIYYYVFDLLWKDGENLMALPLTERKAILNKLVKGNKIIRFSESFEDGEKLFTLMQEMGMEGIVSKRMDSIYRPGERTSNWLKIPTVKRQEFVIGGWVESDRGRPFASLLFGAYNNKKFEWIGHASGGFKEKEMVAILKQLQKSEIKKSPFENKVDSNGIAHWVKPELVANFRFATWTKSGRIRKPAIFLGFRTDKKAKDVVREAPVETGKLIEIKNIKKEKPAGIVKIKLRGKNQASINK